MPKHTLLLVPDPLTTQSGMMRIVASDSDANGVFAFTAKIGYAYNDPPLGLRA